MKTCTRCREHGRLKLSKEEYVIETRHLYRPTVVMEELEVYQCIICGESEPTEHSQFLIRSLKQKLRKEMEEMAAKSTNEWDAIYFIKRAFRRFTG